jgi:ABC-2 type transport system permease protein
MKYMNLFHDAWFIARKDVQYIIRERESILWLFVMPVVFFYFIGTITGGFAGSGPAKSHLAVQMPDDAGFLGGDLVGRLEKAGFQVEQPESAAEFEKASRKLIVPPHFSQSVLAGVKSVLEFSQKEAGLSQQFDELRVRRAAYTVLANLVACKAAGQEPNAETLARFDTMPRSLKLEVQSGGQRKEIPTGFEQAIPGTMVMFTMIVLLTSGATTLVAERRLGVLRRLASTPISRNAVVLGKWGGRLGLGFVQIAFAMAAGTLLFHMDWGPNLPMVMLVLLGWGGLCASLALLLGSLATSEGQAVGIGVLTSNALAALGGCWWPIEITPPWMQSLSKVLPTGWAMDAMHKLISFQSGPTSVLPHLLALFGSALVVGWVAARRFRFQ